MLEKVVACGHALSDSCIKFFGTRLRTEKNSYESPECVLCDVNYQKAVFRFVPPTASIRRLSVDGSGVKGIIPLMFLQHIDSLLAPLGLPVQDYFDLVFGTSAGAFEGPEFVTLLTEQVVLLLLVCSFYNGVYLNPLDILRKLQ